ncbi:Stk1 family PASTA domain-containing Ser/Thr kinase [Lysinibacillus sp. KU-BSD001]|uniref:Stk1 family PASTA domain-containing Ser/Thr kinase n=1 Tax=Lysinibacillus sp. KU-BSD001 TaxID=3141328 RepID=UPI0036F014FA
MLIGKRVSERYEILSLIGGGGMSNVYLAHDIILGRDVAIKILRYDFTNEEELHRRFQREALSATSLTHPNIVSVYDVGEDGDMHYIVMEHIKGKTLKQYIQEFSPVSAAKSVQIMKQLTSAIAHAHENGIIHRDIKPQNILVDMEGNVKITDFGIATTLNATSYTQTNSVMGTVHYLSPEQARGGIATKKSDIYSLGIVLYELLTGELPFSGESAVSIALKHLQSETPSIRAIDASIPQTLENVVLKATAKDPNHRYASVDEIEEDLQTCLSVARQHEPKFIPPLDDDATKAIPIIKEKISTNDILQTKKVEPVRPQSQLSTEVPKESLTKPKKKKWPLIVGALVTLALLFLVFMFTVTPNKKEIPDVSTLTVEEATTMLEDAGFVLGEPIERHDEVEKGIVIETNPKAGLLRAKGAEIQLVVSLGSETITLDNYVGVQLTQVLPIIEKGGFKDVDIVEVFDSKQPPGEIISQEPAANTEVVAKDTVLKLQVSKGKNTVIVSDLRNFTEAAAKEYARNSGFNIQFGTPEHSETVAAGSVMSQTPKANTPLEVGATIKVVLSKGPAEKNVKWYYKTVDIPYEGGIDENGEPIPQTIQVYIQDKLHTMADPIDEFTITEDTTYQIQLEIVEGEKAAYRIARDSADFAKETISYDEIIQ